MRVLILGAGGMLGHKLTMILNDSFDVYTATRAEFSHYEKFSIFNSSRHIGNFDALNENSVRQLIKKNDPQVVLNCLGVTTRKLNQGGTPTVIKINSLLPHVLAECCLLNNARFIHFSTDCVFSGHKGAYLETDLTDARDLYGLSKILGEVNESHCLTLRSSIIGREIYHHTELVEWLISQKGKSVTGYSQAFYTGVTTNAMARVVSDIITNHKDLSGIYQLASPKISKFELLNSLNQTLHLNIDISPNSDYRSDKSLDGSRLAKVVPSADKLNWKEMMMELADETDLYEKWKSNDTQR